MALQFHASVSERLFTAVGFILHKEKGSGQKHEFRSKREKPTCSVSAPSTPRGPASLWWLRGSAAAHVHDLLFAKAGNYREIFGNGSEVFSLTMETFRKIHRLRRKAAASGQKLRVFKTLTPSAQN